MKSMNAQGAKPTGWWSRLLQKQVVLCAAIAVTGGLVQLATISHNWSQSRIMAVVAMAWVAMATVVPTSFKSAINNGAAFQLLVVGWRLGAMLPALYFASFLVGDARNCFLVTLMPCYFVALPLESWLLAREARQE